MHFILKGNDSQFYLLPNKTYTLGRKQADIIITKNNDSISSKHANFVVTNEEVVLTDTGSKYGTFVNQTKLIPLKKLKLNNGDTIKFGLKSIFRFQMVSIINTTSGIRSEFKLKLKQDMTFLGGLLISSWSTKCNYVTVEELMLTVKVLSAVIIGTPIVSLNYWADYIKCVNSNEPLPDASQYVPKCSEVIVNDNVSFEYKEERKNVFKNKIFVFTNKVDKERMTSLVESAGGDAQDWYEEPLDINKVKNSTSEYVFMHASDLNDTIRQDESLSNFVDSYIKLGYRIIPLQEIALGILNCSTEKDCNPKFNRKACVFTTSTQKQEQTENCLAMATQSMDFAKAIGDIKSEIIIPQSFDIDINTDIESKIEIDETKVEKFEIADEVELKTQEADASLKRESDSSHNENSSKRIKIKETPTQNENKFLSRSVSIVEPKPEGSPNQPSAKSLFAFKHTNIATEQLNSSMVLNPFSKKRKAEPNETSNVFKKPSLLNDSISSTSSKSNKLTLNPFSNMFKSRISTQKENVDVSKVTSTPKTKSTDKVDAKDTNSLEIDYSAIPIVDANLEKSLQWISRSSNKSYSTNVDESADQNLLIFINSFRDAVIIEEDDDMIVRKQTVLPSKNITHGGDLKNYKKFKKVQPFKVQTNIIPESRYVSIICNDVNEHEYTSEELQNDVEDIDSQAMGEQQRRRPYVL